MDTDLIDLLVSQWHTIRPDLGVRVHLTKAGRELVDQAIVARFEEASEIESFLEKKEADTIARLLAKIERGVARA